MAEKDVPKLVRGQIEQRTVHTDLSKYIDAIEAGTYVPVVSNEEIAAVNPGQWDKMMELRNKLKVERNALIAVLLNDIWKRVKQSWSSVEVEAGYSLPSENVVLIVPFKGAKDAPYYNNAHDFELLTYNQFIYAMTAWRIDARKQLSKPKETWTSHDHAFQRLELMMKLFNNGAPIDATTFIARGVGTAMRATWSLIQLVPELAKKKGLTLTEAETLDAIRSGYGPIVTIFSSMNIEVGPPLLMGLAKPDTEPGFGFNTAHFDLVENPKGGYKLTFDHSVLPTITDKHGNSILEKTPVTDTTWCPVRYSARGETDIMRELFEKCLELARVYYLPYR